MIKLFQDARLSYLELGVNRTELPVWQDGVREYDPSMVSMFRTVTARVDEPLMLTRPVVFKLYSDISPSATLIELIIFLLFISSFISVF